jgi:hypothetical protein
MDSSELFSNAGPLTERKTIADSFFNQSSVTGLGATE